MRDRHQTHGLVSVDTFCRVVKRSVLYHCTTLPPSVTPLKTWMTCIVRLHGNSCSFHSRRSILLSPNHHGDTRSLPSLPSVLSGIASQTSSLAVSLSLCAFPWRCSTAAAPRGEQVQHTVVPWCDVIGRFLAGSRSVSSEVHGVNRDRRHRREQTV